MSGTETREKKLEALLSASQILNTSQDADRILKSLLELSIDLIDGGDAGCIFLYNKTSGFLEMYAYVGMGDSVKNVKMLPGESMTGMAFLRNEALFFPDNEVVQKTMSTMSSANTKLAVDGNVIASNIHGSICCPLLYRDETLGVLVIDNFSNQAPLVESDVELLRAISVQATIAIINAKNLEKELENNRKLEQYSKIMKSQRDKYKYSTQVHSKFTDMVLKGSSIDDIIKEIKALSGKEVLVVDIFYNMESHTFERGLPENIKDIRPIIIQKLKRNAKSVFYEPTTHRHYFTFPIMVNQEPMGWLCLISETIPLSENEIITAERSATILALEILKQNELTDLEQSLKGDFLDSLLANDNQDYVLKCSESYQFDLSAAHRVLFLEFSFKDPAFSNTKNYEKRIRDCLKNYYQPFNEYLKMNFPGSVTLIRHHHMVCILETRLGTDLLHVEKVLNFIKREFHQNYSGAFKDLRIRIGISEFFNEMQSFKEAYENARQAVRLIKNDESPINWLYFKDMEVKRFLLANGREDLLDFCNKLLGPLLRYEHASRDDFLQTLEIYLKSNCNWSLSKQRLHIHGNTLTYRLGRIEEILNLDLSDYQDRLRLQIAFEIQELLS